MSARNCPTRSLSRCYQFPPICSSDLARRSSSFTSSALSPCWEYFSCSPARKNSGHSFEHDSTIRGHFSDAPKGHSPANVTSIQNCPGREPCEARLGADKRRWDSHVLFMLNPARHANERSDRVGHGSLDARDIAFTAESRHGPDLASLSNDGFK